MYVPLRELKARVPQQLRTPPVITEVILFVLTVSYFLVTVRHVAIAYNVQVHAS